MTSDVYPWVHPAVRDSNKIMSVGVSFTLFYKNDSSFIVNSIRQAPSFINLCMVWNVVEPEMLETISQFSKSKATCLGFRLA